MGPQRYSRIAIALHWTIALALAFQIAMGWQLEHLDAATGQFRAYQLHKSIGITILLLSLIRVAVRWWKPRPAADHDRPWARWLAGLVHFGLYGFMIGAPLTGWLIVSTARIKVPTLLFGTMPWPNVPLVGALDEAARKGLHDLAENAHGLLAWVGIALFALHVVGAIRHQWLMRQPLIERMLPAGPARLSGTGGLIAFVVALALVLGAFVVGGKARFGTPAPIVAALPPAPVEEAPAPPPPEEPAAVTNVTAPAPEATKPPAWTVSAGGRLGFTASFSGTPIEGSFSRWTAAIVFDPEALETADIRVSIDLASADSGDAERDASLQGDAFFATAAHPRATFRSTAVTARGPGRYRARGTLTIKGASRPMILDFTLKVMGDKADVSGSGAIERGDFAIGTGEWASTDQIAGRVAIDFRFAAIRKD